MEKGKKQKKSWPLQEKKYVEKKDKNWEDPKLGEEEKTKGKM